jgi:hypothetical protein
MMKQTCNILQLTRWFKRHIFMNTNTPTTGVVRCPWYRCQSVRACAASLKFLIAFSWSFKRMSYVFVRRSLPIKYRSYLIPIKTCCTVSRNSPVSSFLQRTSCTSCISLSHDWSDPFHFKHLNPSNVTALFSEQ